MSKKTQEVAKEEGVPSYRILYLLQHGRLTPPPKDSSGDYVWGDGNVRRLRAALAQVKRRRCAATA
jgi:hypothetical protein